MLRSKTYLGILGLTFGTVTGLTGRPSTEANAEANVLQSQVVQEGSLPETLTSATLDIGLVVADLEASVKFYTEALGFEEVPGFSVPGELCRSASLTDGLDLTVRVLRLANVPNATRLKLMSLPEAKPAHSDNTFVHSQLGLSYLTLHVRNAATCVERLEKAGGKLRSQGMVGLGGNNVLCVTSDPDGNLIELVGSKD